MVRNIDLAGIQLDNHTVRESIMITERMMSEESFKTIEEIDLETVLLAQQDETLREIIAGLDHTIISDVGILKAVGEVTLQREGEIKNDDYMFEMLKRVERNHKTVFVLGKTTEDIEKCLNFFGEVFPRIEVVGKLALEEGSVGHEAIVNEINSVIPDMLISILPSPEQEFFLKEYRDQMSAHTWYGIGNKKMDNRKGGFLDKITNMHNVKKLTKHINDYEEQEV